jgi:hypothetical protein
VLSGISPTAAGENPSPKKANLKLIAGGNCFEFATTQVRGEIRADGAYHGVAQLVDVATGRQVIDPRYSALNLFKLMATNQCMGEPRAMQRITKCFPQALEVTWPATPTHKAEITARYEVIEPAAVDLTVTVRSQGTYPAYEVFVPSYFDKKLRPHVYLHAARGGSQPPDLVLPMVSDVYRGTLLVFPRDAHAARHCLDGRWDRDEPNTPIVQQTPVRRYAHCLAFFADLEQQLAVVLMSHPRNAYAISTRYHAENDADRLTSYSAVDFSLFGDDLLPGDVRTARVRLALTALDRQMSQPLKIYEAFLAEVASESAAAAPRGAQRND